MTRHATSLGPMEIDGAPTDAEVAAIVAAVELCWPRPAAGVAEPPTVSTRWRHADRWWAAGRLPNSWT